MQECPHCHQEGITDWQKVLSLTFGPAKCYYCEGKSYLPVINGLVAMTAWIVLTWVCIGLSYMTRSSVFLLGTIPAVFVVIHKYILSPPLQAISRRRR